MNDLPLPPLAEVRDEIIPQASALLSGIPFTSEANVMLLAIGLQESRFRHRRQIRGPARGFWQFEAYGGTRGVLTRRQTRELAERLVEQRHGPLVRFEAINAVLAEDDVLACAFARLLLWTDPRPLPTLGDSGGAWRYYLRNWRPGKPHRGTWDALYARALAVVTTP